MMRSKLVKCTFAGPVPDEGDYTTEIERTWSIDGTWIGPNVLNDGRRQEIKYLSKHGVFEVVGEKECQQERTSKERSGTEGLTSAVMIGSFSGKQNSPFPT